MEEIRHVMIMIGEKVTDEEIEDMIRDFDFDQDGYLSYIEFVDFIERKN